VPKIITQQKSFLKKCTTYFTVSGKFCYYAISYFPLFVKSSSTNMVCTFDLLHKPLTVHLPISSTALTCITELTTIREWNFQNTQWRHFGKSCSFPFLSFPAFPLIFPFFRTLPYPTFSFSLSSLPLFPYPFPFPSLRSKSP